MRRYCYFLEEKKLPQIALPQVDDYVILVLHWYVFFFTLKTICILHEWETNEICLTNYLSVKKFACESFEYLISHEIELKQSNTPLKIYQIPNQKKKKTTCEH